MLHIQEYLLILLFSLHLAGFSYILWSVKVISILGNVCVFSMLSDQMPLFAVLITAIILLLLLRILAGAVTKMLTVWHLNTTVYDVGGDPTLYQHLLWFFGHP